MNYDAGDYDTDDRVFCKDCRDWGWPDSGDVTLCEQCEERFCIDCMKAHTCPVVRDSPAFIKNEQPRAGTEAVVRNSREAHVIAILDKVAASGVDKTLLAGLGECIRRTWQAGFDAARAGEPDVMRDDEQLHHAVLSGIRCYRGHHPTHIAAKGLAGWESSSLAKRIVGSLKSLAQGHALQAGSKAQLKRQRRDERLGLPAPPASR